MLNVYVIESNAFIPYRYLKTCSFPKLKQEFSEDQSPFLNFTLLESFELDSRHFKICSPRDSTKFRSVSFRSIFFFPFFRDASEAKNPIFLQKLELRREIPDTNARETFYLRFNKSHRGRNITWPQSHHQPGL